MIASSTDHGLVCKGLDSFFYEYDIPIINVLSMWFTVFISDAWRINPLFSDVRFCMYLFRLSLYWFTFDGWLTRSRRLGEDVKSMKGFLQIFV